MSDNFKNEVKAGQRFTFGDNWKAFLSVLDEDRIVEAEKSLIEKLGTHRLDGLTFLDAGCGSGLFSLAAKRLGARVFSFDFDPQSVACTEILRGRYFPNESDDAWKIIEGSVLDTDFVKSLGLFDIVYSWGVLHHTGNMALGLSNIDLPVKEGGKLFIAIYNDEGFGSKMWLFIKKMYNANILGRYLMTAICVSIFFLGRLVVDVLLLQNPFKRYAEYKKKRGMSVYHDWIDWIGGLPFEVASVKQLFDLYAFKHYSLTYIQTTNRFGCNELVFEKKH